MDNRTRQLERAWRETNDEEYHVAFLRELLRAGLLEERRILCAGFFGHKPSRKVLPELIKKYKVITPQKVLKTEELNDFITDIFFWPRDIYLRAVLATIKLAGRSITMNRMKDDLKIISEKLNSYIENPNEENTKSLQSSFSRRHDWFEYSGRYSYSSRQFMLRNHIAEIFSYILPEISRQNLVRIVMNIGANTKDKIFRKAMHDEVIPSLLGEWA